MIKWRRVPGPHGHILLLPFLQYVFFSLATSLYSDIVLNVTFLFWISYIAALELFRGTVTCVRSCMAVSHIESASHHSMSYHS